MKTDIPSIKELIEKKPEFVLVKNKHRLNYLWMRERFPFLSNYSSDLVVNMFKVLVTLDRDVRRAKEELKDEKKISISASEEELLVILEQEKQIELGYESGYNEKPYEKKI